MNKDKSRNEVKTTLRRGHKTKVKGLTAYGARRTARKNMKMDEEGSEPLAVLRTQIT